MKKTKKMKILSLFLVMGFSLVLVVPLFAVSENIPENPTTITQEADDVLRQKARENIDRPEARTVQVAEERAEAREEMKAEVGERIKKNCETNKERMLNVKTRSEDFQAKHQEIYARWGEKVARLVVKLDAAGADTAKLRTDIEVLSGMIAEKNGEFSVYHESLNTLGVDNDCGEDPAGFYTVLQDSRTSRKQVLDSLQGIRTFIQDTIKPDLQDIKVQLTSSSAAIEEG